MVEVVREKCRIQCSDDQIIEVDLEDAKRSPVIAGLIDDGGIEEAIPVTQVNRETMEKIMELCEHMRETGTEPEIE